MNIFRKKFPYIHQLDAMQCGVACLQMICKFWGRKYTITELEKICPPTKEGVSLLALSRSAEQLGFRQLCGRFSIDDLPNLALPCILHWEQSHFVVLYEVKRKRKGTSYRIADPNKGLLCYGREEMQKHWVSIVSQGKKKGIAMLLETTPAFFQRLSDYKEPVKSDRFLIGYLVRYKWSMLQIFCGMLMGCVLQLVFPLLTQSVVDIGIEKKDIHFIYLVLIGQVMLTLGSCGLDFIRGWLLLHIGVRINISLVSDFFAKLLSLPMSYFDTKKVGDILQRISDHGRVQNFLTNSLLSICFSLISFIVLGLVLLYYNSLIFGVFVFFTILQSCWMWYFLDRRRLLDFENFEKHAYSQNKTLQLIDSIQEIKLQGCKARRKCEWEEAQLGIFDVQIKYLKMSQCQEIGGILIGNLKGFIVVVLSAQAVIGGTISFGMMLAIQYIVGQLVSPVEQIMNFIYSLQDLKIGLERINDVHSQVKEGEFGKNMIPQLNHKEIRLENVSFRYSVNSPQLTLSDINIALEEGKVTAIVGASGSGKTTLLKLLLGYYDNYEGNILIDNISLRDLDVEWWRSRCGVVMQEGKIFSESIARNIAVDDSDVDDARLYQAATIANLNKYIGTLPMRYETMIGGDGRGLSMGQKQRILIARAVYKSPEFLFLDEATNSLDATNEQQIVNNLDDFFIGKTVLLIAHRLSTVRKADKILVMDSGRIVEMGTHDTLVSQKGYYYRLIKNQLEL